MKIVAAFFLLITFISCGQKAIEKPDNLIDEDKMITILYDLSLLEAIKSQKPAVLDSNQVDVTKYIYKKYKIDSLQFANSSQYYASHIENYKLMYEEVAKKLDESAAKSEALVKKSGGKVPDNSDVPRVE